MKKLNLTLALLTATLPVGTSAAPVYEQSPPASFCEPAKNLQKQAQSCRENRVFLENADKCWANLEDLEIKVTKELDAKIGTLGSAQQSGSFQAGAENYEESIAAWEYLMAVTFTASKEIDSYFDYVVYPEHAETDQEILATGCYGETVKPLDQLLDKFHRKRAELAEKIESAEGKISQLKTQNTKIDALNKTKVNTKGAGTSASPTGKERRKSDISGTEDKQKEKK